MSKICTKCGIDKPLGEFNRSRSHEDGRSYACRSCHRDYYAKSPRKHWAKGSHQNHRKRGYEFLFSWQDLEVLANVTDNCKFCNVTLNWSPGKKVMGPTSPTMDRIDSGKCMGLKDIQILCNLCNRTKGERTMKEFVDYCARIVEDFG